MFSAFQKVSQALRGVSVAVTSFFNLVTLLLNTTSTNGAQNNTFLDTSSIGNTVTRNGTPTQGTFTPFSQTGWSNYATADSSYLNFTTSPGTLFQFAGDFTIESWVNLSTTSAGTSIWVTNDGSANYFALNINGSNFEIFLNGTGPASSSIPNGLVIGQWSHVAMVRSGSTITLYTNGVSKGTISNSSTLGYANPTLNRNGGGAAGCNWYLSNLRIVKGTAVYTSAFTPSTTPLTNIANTSLLTCQSNRFVDNSSNALVATVTGTPSVQAFSPFLPTASYSTSTVGGSGFFVNATDYLTLPTGSVNVGSTDFTIAAWIYPLDRTNGYYMFGGQSDRTTQGGSSYNWSLSASTGNMNAELYVGGGNYNFSASSTPPPINAWSYVVLARTGGTASLFVNGNRVGTNATLGSATINTGSTTYAPAIGANGAGSSTTFNGYISSLRFIIGSGGVDATQTTITVPTAPPTDITNTKLLANFTNAGIYDAAAKNDLLTVGNAQVSTTQAKFGTTSIYLDGSGDYLTRPNSNLYDFGTGEFTIEMFIYPTSVTGGDKVIMDTRASGSDAGYTPYITTGSKLAIYSSGADRITSSTSISANTWTCIAFVRYGTTLAIYINGVRDATATYASAMSCLGRVSIGCGFDNAANLPAYLDEIRITKGYAVYSGATYTVPTAPFPTL
jgi:hypothetical protein